MSVNWSATIGYGYIFNYDTLEKVVGTYHDLAQDFDSELENHYPLLEVGYAGDAFTANGSERFIFIKDSVVDGRDWVQTFDINKLTESLTGEGMEQLQEFVRETGAVIGEPVWRLCIKCG